MKDRAYSGSHRNRRGSLLLLVLLHLFLYWDGSLAAEAGGKNLVRYVGSLACKECHAEEYANFITYAKKSISFEHIERQAKHLNPEEIRQCYPCHTTGYGQYGGFVSPEETPELKNAGCEVCHGPGEAHVRTRAAGDIKGKLSKKDCEKCHISERVRAFRYKPLIHGGAH